MDYFKHYNKLIETRKNRILHSNVYYEKHHILPKCQGGSDIRENIVYLTFKEHYMAHYLLTKMYPENSGIQYAFLCMIRDPHGKRPITANMFNNIKENYRKFMKWHFKISNPMHLQSVKNKHSERMKKNNPQHIPGNKCRRFEISPSKGKKAYNNGIKNEYFVEGTQPEGWYRGLLKYKRQWTPRKKSGVEK